VVLIPSIINRARIFDLAPEQSLAAHLLAAGLDVFLVDWGEPTPADAHLGLGDYALRYVRRAVRGALTAAGAEQVHLMGYCLGGTFSLIAATRLPEVASVCALTTPVDLADPGPLGVLTDRRLVDVEALAAWPVVSAGLLWSAFQALDPVGIGRKWRGFLRLLRQPKRRRRFLAQEGWLGDPVPMTGRAVREVVDLYQRNALATGALRLEGAPVRLADGRAPVLNLIAERDTVVPAAASRALDGLWGGPVDTHTFPGGHIGVCVGSRAPGAMWAVTTEWLTSRQPASSKLEVTP
jgi:polyhydroxyalkanoate synthase